MTGTLRQRGPNAWEMRVSTGRDPLTGHYRQVTRTVHGTKTQAKRALGELAEEVAKGRHTGTDATLGTLVTKWLEMVELEGLQRTTLQGYRKNIRVHIEPSSLWATPLRKLTHNQLDDFYGDLRRRKGLSAATTTRVHAVLRQALKEGQRLGWIASSPAALTRPIKQARYEPTPPAPADVLRLIAAADEADPDFAVLLRVAAATGARRGELCALRWKHVDFEGASLFIEHAIVDTEDGPVEKDTKSHQARRVSLDPDTVDVLAAYRQAAEKRAADCGEAIGPDAYLFGPDADGRRPWRPDSVTGRFRLLRDRLGLAGVRFHDVRHGHATYLLAAGVPVKTVASRLGHADASVTLRVYAHALDAADQDAAAVIGGLLAAPHVEVEPDA